VVNLADTDWGVKPVFFNDPKSESTEVRWQDQSEISKAVWNYYDCEVVPQIVKQAMQVKRPVKLSELYHVLSMARYKCEYVKENAKASWEIKKLANAPLPNEICNFYYQDLGSNRRFGIFQISGTSEPNVTNSAAWGSDVALLSSNRIRDRVSGRIGLSTIQSYDNKEKTVAHPIATVLDRLEPDFKQLLESTHPFEFFRIASRLIYELSNYPPIGRGSAAVNAWIIDNIFRNKFNCDFNIMSRLRDWVAFYENAEQYTAYFVISCLTKYIEHKMPDCYNHNKVFFESIYQKMILDPNLLENTSVRESVWNELRDILGKYDNQDDILFKNKDNWQLIFRKPSDTIRLIISGENNAVDHADYLKMLFDLDEKLSDAHVEAFGDLKKENDLNKIWIDLEFLRALPKENIELIKNAIGYIAKNTHLSTDIVSRSNEIDPMMYGNFYFHIGHGIVNKDLMSNVDSEWHRKDIYKEYVRQIRVSMMNGGMKLSDLSCFDEILSVISSYAANVLYASNNYIRVSDISASTVVESENNILRLIARYITREEYTEIVDKEICHVLTSPMCCFLYQNNAAKISDLVSENLSKLKRNIINAYLEHCFNDKEAIALFEKASEEKINDCWLNLKYVVKAMIAGRLGMKRLQEIPFKVSTILQLDRGGASLLMSTLEPGLSPGEDWDDRCLLLDKLRKIEEQTPRPNSKPAQKS